MKKTDSSTIDTLVDLYATGVSVSIAAERVGLCYDTARKHLNERGVYISPKPYLTRPGRAPVPCEAHGLNRKECKVCIADRHRWWNVARKYGVSREEYARLYEAQDGVCGKCCKRTTYPLRVDHDHITGEIRGLLCAPCNTAIGLLGDDEEGLLEAIAYLRRSRP